MGNLEVRSKNTGTSGKLTVENMHGESPQEMRSVSDALYDLDKNLFYVGLVHIHVSMHVSVYFCEAQL